MDKNTKVILKKQYFYFNNYYYLIIQKSLLFLEGMYMHCSGLTFFCQNILSFTNFKSVYDFLSKTFN